VRLIFYDAARRAISTSDPVPITLHGHTATVPQRTTKGHLTLKYVHGFWYFNSF